MLFNEAETLRKLPGVQAVGSFMFVHNLLKSQMKVKWLDKQED